MNKTAIATALTTLAISAFPVQVYAGTPSRYAVGSHSTACVSALCNQPAPNRGTASVANYRPVDTSDEKEGTSQGKRAGNNAVTRLSNTVGRREVAVLSTTAAAYLESRGKHKKARVLSGIATLSNTMGALDTRRSENERMLSGAAAASSAMAAFSKGNTARTAANVAAVATAGNYTYHSANTGGSRNMPSAPDTRSTADYAAPSYVNTVQRTSGGSSYNRSTYIRPTTVNSSLASRSLNSGGTLFFGDSIAHGYRNASKSSGITKEGANPQQVLNFIRNYSGNLQGQTVVLSSGMSNNPTDTAAIRTQIRALRSRGANVRLLGVSNTYNLNGQNGAQMNAKLNRIAREENASFMGGFQAGRDNVHPAGYNPSHFGL